MIRRLVVSDVPSLPPFYSHHSETFRKISPDSPSRKPAFNIDFLESQICNPGWTKLIHLGFIYLFIHFILFCCCATPTPLKWYRVHKGYGTLYKSYCDNPAFLSLLSARTIQQSYRFRTCSMQSLVRQRHWWIRGTQTQRLSCILSKAPHEDAACDESQEMQWVS